MLEVDQAVEGPALGEVLRGGRHVLSQSHTAKPAPALRTLGECTGSSNINSHLDNRTPQKSGAEARASLTPCHLADHKLAPSAHQSDCTKRLPSAPPLKGQEAEGERTGNSHCSIRNAPTAIDSWMTTYCSTPTRLLCKNSV
jgi:hypothetical protein